MGTGFLGEPVNKINLWVQELGFGEGNLESPITTASVDLLLDSVLAEDPEADPITIVSKCAFSSEEDIDIGTGKSDGKLICKLLNADGNAIAEGDITFSQYTAGDIIEIPITQPIFIGATNFDNVFDAMVIVQGPL
jgi:hypothetical protein